MTIKHLETLYTLLNTHHVLLENEHFVESVSLIDESMIARRPSGWFCKNDRPHVDINASRWGSIQVDAYAVTQSGAIMIVDDEGNSWSLQVLAPMDMHQVKNLLDELKED